MVSARWVGVNTLYKPAMSTLRLDIITRVKVGGDGASRRGGGGRGGGDGWPSAGTTCRGGGGGGGVGEGDRGLGGGGRDGACAGVDKTDVQPLGV